jgi:hypothetical protein
MGLSRSGWKNDQPTQCLPKIDPPLPDVGPCNGIFCKLDPSSGQSHSKINKGEIHGLWNYYGKLIGGYTIRLAVQHMSPKEKERFIETMDYSMED